MEKQITILLADDNALFRESMRTLLDVLPDVTVCGEVKNGEEAIAFALEHAPDIILMDINMSPINGFEATRKILRQNPSIKIIGLSMHTTASYCMNLLRLGARGYITKDAGPEEIRMAITEVKEGRKYVGQNIRSRNS